MFYFLHSSLTIKLSTVLRCCVRLNVNREEKGLLVNNFSATKIFRDYIYTTCFLHRMKMTTRYSHTKAKKGSLLLSIFLKFLRLDLKFYDTFISGLQNWEDKSEQFLSKETNFWKASEFFSRILNVRSLMLTAVLLILT